MKDAQLPAIISDADVLIDYLESNREVLAKVSKKICNVYISLPTLSEIKQLSENEAKKHGLTVFEPTLRQIGEASQRGGSLSFEDKLCFIIARDKKWTCVTNFIKKLK